MGGNIKVFPSPDYWNTSSSDDLCGEELQNILGRKYKISFEDRLLKRRTNFVLRKEKRVSLEISKTSPPDYWNWSSCKDRFFSLENPTLKEERTLDRPSYFLKSLTPGRKTIL